MNFSDIKAERIERILGSKAVIEERSITLKISGDEGSTSIVLVVASSSEDSTLVSAQTSYGYFELHNLVRIVPIEPDEVIFVGSQDESISGMVIGSKGTCSLFANVSSSILSADLFSLDPSLLLAAMQLGLTETAPAE